MIVVAKMYVASVNTSGNCFDTEKTGTRVNLNCVYSPDPETENHSFWKASPSGTLKISFPMGIEVPPVFKAGQCFKVFHEKSENGKWKLVYNNLDDGRMSIQLTASADPQNFWADINAHEEMSIDNKDVFAFYSNDKDTFRVWLVPVDKEGNVTGDSIEVI